jgi:hypothetical protein
MGCLYGRNSKDGGKCTFKYPRSVFIEEKLSSEDVDLTEAMEFFMGITDAIESVLSNKPG